MTPFSYPRDEKIQDLLFGSPATKKWWLAKLVGVTVGTVERLHASVDRTGNSVHKTLLSLSSGSIKLVVDYVGTEQCTYPYL